MLREIPEVEILDVADRVFLMHQGGKLEVRFARAAQDLRDDLSMAYTPGVARVCKAIADDPEASFSLTVRRNTVAVVSDGSAVLGLGNEAPGPPCRLWKARQSCSKSSAGVDAFPICLDTLRPSTTIVERR